MADRRDALLEAFNEAEEEFDPTGDNSPGTTNEVPAGNEADASAGKEQSPDQEVEAAIDEKPGEQKEAAARVRGPDGKFVKADNNAGAPAASAKPATEQKPGQEQVPSGEDRAPNAWPATAREQWAKLPPDVRAVVTRREQEIQRQLSNTATSRRLADEFRATIQPFEHLIRAQNATPIQAVQSLMRTSAALMTGNQELKARVLKDIIETYKVDLPTLDAVLSGTALPPSAGNASPQNIQALVQQGIQAHMDGLRRQAQESQAQQVNQDLESFAKDPKHEFFEDLRYDMGAIMDAAARRGKVMTMQEAYDQAIKLNPDIEAIIHQRGGQGGNNQNQQQQNQGQQRTVDIQRKRRAASSIAGKPSGGGSGPGVPKDRRSAIEAAFEAATEQ